MAIHQLISSLRQAKLELQHDYILEQFWFIDDKRVVATLGTKNGPICGPILNYKITDDDAVEIIGSDGVRVYEWKQVRICGDWLTVLCDGIAKKFNITKVPKKKRQLP